MSVNQGRRVEVSHPDFQGLAGFVDRGDTGSLSYPSAQRDVLPGSEVEIEGVTWTVSQEAESRYVPGYRVLSLWKGH